MDIEILSVLEGMLFLSGDDGLTIKAITNVLELSKSEATQYMDQLIEVVNSREVKGIEIVNYGGVYKFVTLSKHNDYYSKMYETSQSKLSNAALETLAIIAYNQPITRSGIEDIRGVNSDAMVRKLIAKALIKEVGREDTPGKPLLYAVTQEFMDAFSLTTLDELPVLEEIKSEFDDDDIYNTKYIEDLENENEEHN